MKMPRTFPFILSLVVSSLIYQNGASPDAPQRLSKTDQIMTATRNISVMNDAIITESPPDHCPPFCQCTMSPKIIRVERCSQDPAKFLDPLLSNALGISSLTITYSSLSHLPKVVCDLTELTRLDVTKNKLVDLPWNCLKQMKNLNSIIASRNNFKRLRNGSFYDFPALQELVLEHNHITEIDLDVFTQVDRLSLLSIINLESNLLVSVDPWPLMFMDSLPKITLSNNLISTFTNNINWTYTCQNKKPSANVDLRYNNITHMTDMIKWVGDANEADLLCGVGGGAVHLDIRENPFICDCIDYKVYRYLHLVWTSEIVEELLCKAPEWMYDKRIFVVPLDEFVCHVDEVCPEHCKCIHQPNQMNMSIDCIGSGVTEMPKLLPSLPKKHYTYALNFVDNDIKSVEYRDYFEHTRMALFSYNKIQNISFSAFRALSKAEVLHLDHNKLQYLPQNVSEVNITSSMDLHLEANNWRCDCHGKETYTWMNAMKHVISDNQGVLCKDPSHVANLNLLRLSIENMICGSPLNIVLLVSLGSVGGTVLLCFILIATPTVIISKHRVWVYKKLRWHPFDSDECEGENKVFDIFVSYANENEEYVEEHIIPGLEQRGYKIAYHRVHFLAGKPIHVSIEECILQSKRTLVVFSKEFMESVWSMWEFTVALELDGNEGTHRLFAIKYEDIDVKSLDLTLQAYFSRYTYVERNSSRFWDNLEYSLPMNKMGKAGGTARNVEDYVSQAAELTEEETYTETEQTVLLHTFP